MRKLLLLLMLVPFVISCSSDDTNGPKDITGKIKSETLWLGDETMLFHKFKMRYNSEGFIERTIDERESGYFGTTIYEYSNNNIVKWTLYTELFILETECFYKNGLIEKTVTHHDYFYSSDYTSRKYAYDFHGNLIKVDYYQGDILEHEAEFFYENGNISKRVGMTSGKETPYVNTYTYDDKKNPYTGAFPEAFLKIREIGKHNIIKKNEQLLRYEYNEKELPVKQVSAGEVYYYEYY